MTGAARLLHTQQVHYLRKRVNYNDRGIASGVYMGTLPAGAMIVMQNVRVSTAFNGTGPAINVGITPLGSELFTDAATAGARSPTIPNISFAADTDIFVSSPATAGPTAGVGDVIIGFVPNNDQ
jgi:hypothetical protein